MEMLTKKMLGDSEVKKAEKPKYDFSDENLVNLPSRVLEGYLAEKYGTDKYVRERSSVFEEASKNKISDRESILTGPELEALSLVFEEQIKKMKNKAKGGVAEQMEMFQEGGLKDEGGTVDPVSGNEVPPGSTQEEVRDDIPAQLSEGEFVFPADVVRYIGLEKLMMLRQEAKAGLKRMEEMGQMGNADEATLPDDIPFTVDDLDTREETEEEKQEMAQGGVIQAQAGTYVAPNFTGTFTQPSAVAPQFSTTNVQQPSNLPLTQNLSPAPVGGFRPIQFQQPPQATGETFTYDQLLGSKPGQYDEFREYKNAEGMILNIPFKNGQPLYPVPEGYSYVDPEEVKVEDPKVTQVKPQTTRVVEDTSSGDDYEKPKGAVDLTGATLSYKSIFNMDKLDTELKNIASNQFNLFNLYGAVDRGVTGTIDLNNAILEAQKVTMRDFKNTARGTTNFNLVDLREDERDDLAGKLSGTSKTYENLFTDIDGKSLSLDELIDKVNEISAKTGGKKLSMDNFTAVTQTGKKTNIVSKRKVNTVLRSLVMDTKFKEERRKQKNVEQVKKNEEEGFFKDIPDKIEPSYEESDYSPSTTFGGTETTEEQLSDAGGSFVGDDPPFKQGGLLKKKPKVKKMKRGGLASR